MDNEPHSYYFCQALEGKEHGEHDATSFDKFVNSRRVIAVTVVVHREEERIQKDQEDDEVIEPANCVNQGCVTSTR